MITLLFILTRVYLLVYDRICLSADRLNFFIVLNIAYCYYFFKLYFCVNISDFTFVVIVCVYSYTYCVTRYGLFTFCHCFCAAKLHIALHALWFILFIVLCFCSVLSVLFFPVTCVSATLFDVSKASWGDKQWWWRWKWPLCHHISRILYALTACGCLLAAELTAKIDALMFVGG